MGHGETFMPVINKPLLHLIDAIKLIRVFKLEIAP